jgi:hypothetical protein
MNIYLITFYYILIVHIIIYISESYYVSKLKISIYHEFRFVEPHSFKSYPSSCLSFKTQFNSLSFSVPHRKYITSPLRAQQVNAIYRFVTMVY